MKLQVNKDFYKMKKFWVAVLIASSFVFPQVRDIADEVIDMTAVEKVLE